MRLASQAARVCQAQSVALTLNRGLMPSNARAQRIVVHDVAVAVRADVAVMEHHLAAVHAGEAVPEVGPPLAQRLDLRALERDPRLELLLDREVVDRLAIGCDDLLFPLFRHGALG